MEASDEVVLNRKKELHRFFLSLLLAIPLFNVLVGGIFVITCLFLIYLRSASRGKDLLSLMMLVAAWGGAAFLAYFLAGDAFLVTASILQFIATFLTAGRLRHLL